MNEKTSLLRRSLSAGLSGAFFFSNVLFAHAAESNFWSTRRTAARERVQSQAEPVVVASLPRSSASRGDAALLAQLPAVQPLGLSHPSPAGALTSQDLGAPGGAAAPAWLSQLVQPYGNIREIHLASANAPLVVHIQDLHGEYDAQKNTAEIIKALNEARGVTLIGVEGARGPLALDALRAYPEPEIKEQVFNYFLKRGDLGGPEYIGLTSVKPLTLWGVETMADYAANIDAVKQSLHRRGDATVFLREQDSSLAVLKGRFYSEELKRADLDAQAYRAGRQGLAAHLNGLRVTYGRVVGAPLADRFPNLDRLGAALRSEASLDFKAVEKDRLQLIEALVARLDKPALSALVQKSAEHRAGRLGYGDYYGYVKTLCARHGVSLDGFPRLAAYVAYIRSAEGINRDALLAELAGLEAAVQDGLATTDDQRRLVALDRDAVLLGKLLDLKMAPEDWALYDARRAGVLALADRARALQSRDFPKPSAAFLQPFEDFCRYALRRNEALSQNLLDKMAQDKAASAVLVTGGFHTDGLTRRFRDKDVSYVVITPKVEEINETRNYLDVFAHDPVPLEKLFSGEPISLIQPLATSSAAGSSPVPPAIHIRLMALLLAKWRQALTSQKISDVRHVLAERLRKLSGYAKGVVDFTGFFVKGNKFGFTAATPGGSSYAVMVEPGAEEPVVSVEASLFSVVNYLRKPWGTFFSVQATIPSTIELGYIVIVGTLLLGAMGTGFLMDLPFVALFLGLAAQPFAMKWWISSKEWSLTKKIVKFFSSVFLAGFWEHKWLSSRSGRKGWLMLHETSNVEEQKALRKVGRRFAALERLYGRRYGAVIGYVIHVAAHSWNNLAYYVWPSAWRFPTRAGVRVLATTGKSPPENPIEPGSDPSRTAVGNESTRHSDEYTTVDHFRDLPGWDTLSVEGKNKIHFKNSSDADLILNLLKSREFIVFSLNDIYEINIPANVPLTVRVLSKGGVGAYKAYTQVSVIMGNESYSLGVLAGNFTENEYHEKKRLEKYGVGPRLGVFVNSQVLSVQPIEGETLKDVFSRDKSLGYRIYIRLLLKLRRLHLSVGDLSVSNIISSSALSDPVIIDHMGLQENVSESSLISEIFREIFVLNRLASKAVDELPSIIEALLSVAESESADRDLNALLLTEVNLLLQESHKKYNPHLRPFCLKAISILRDKLSQNEMNSYQKFLTTSLGGWIFTKVSPGFFEFFTEVFYAPLNEMTSIFHPVRWFHAHARWRSGFQKKMGIFLILLSVVGLSVGISFAVYVVSFGFPATVTETIARAGLFLLSPLVGWGATILTESLLNLIANVFNRGIFRGLLGRLKISKDYHFPRLTTGLMPEVHTPYKPILENFELIESAGRVEDGMAFPGSGGWFSREVLIMDARYDRRLRRFLDNAMDQINPRMDGSMIVATLFMYLERHMRIPTESEEAFINKNSMFNNGNPVWFGQLISFGQDDKEGLGFGVCRMKAPLLQRMFQEAAARYPEKFIKKDPPRLWRGNVDVQIPEEEVFRYEQKLEPNSRIVKDDRGSYRMRIGRHIWIQFSIIKSGIKYLLFVDPMWGEIDVIPAASAEEDEGSSSSIKTYLKDDSFDALKRDFREFVPFFPNGDFFGRRGRFGESNLKVGYVRVPYRPEVSTVEDSEQSEERYFRELGLIFLGDGEFQVVENWKTTLTPSDAIIARRYKDRNAMLSYARDVFIKSFVLSGSLSQLRDFRKVANSTTLVIDWLESQSKSGVHFIGRENSDKLRQLFVEILGMPVGNVDFTRIRIETIQSIMRGRYHRFVEEKDKEEEAKKKRDQFVNSCINQRIVISVGNGFYRVIIPDSWGQDPLRYDPSTIVESKVFEKAQDAVRIIRERTAAQQKPEPDKMWEWKQDRLHPDGEVKDMQINTPELIDYARTMQPISFSFGPGEIVFYIFHRRDLPSKLLSQFSAGDYFLVSKAFLESGDNTFSPVHLSDGIDIKIGRHFFPTLPKYISQDQLQIIRKGDGFTIKNIGQADVRLGVGNNGAYLDKLAGMYEVMGVLRRDVYANRMASVDRLWRPRKPVDDVAMSQEFPGDLSGAVVFSDYISSRDLTSNGWDSWMRLFPLWKEIIDLSSAENGALKELQNKRKEFINLFFTFLSKYEIKPGHFDRYTLERALLLNNTEIIYKHIKSSLPNDKKNLDALARFFAETILVDTININYFIKTRENADFRSETQGRMAVWGDRNRLGLVMETVFSILPMAPLFLGFDIGFGGNFSVYSLFALAGFGGAAGLAVLFAGHMIFGVRLTDGTVVRWNLLPGGRADLGTAFRAALEATGVASRSLLAVPFVAAASWVAWPLALALGGAGVVLGAVWHAWANYVRASGREIRVSPQVTVGARRVSISDDGRVSADLPSIRGFLREAFLGGPAGPGVSQAVDRLSGYEFLTFRGPKVTSGDFGALDLGNDASRESAFARAVRDYAATVLEKSTEIDRTNFVARMADYVLRWNLENLYVQAVESRAYPQAPVWIEVPSEAELKNPDGVALQAFRAAVAVQSRVATGHPNRALALISKESETGQALAARVREAMGDLPLPGGLVFFGAQDAPETLNNGKLDVSFLMKLLQTDLAPTILGNRESFNLGRLNVFFLPYLNIAASLHQAIEAEKLFQISA